MGTIAVAVLGVFVWFFFTSQEEYRKTDRAKVQVGMVAEALRGYASRKGRFPSADQGLDVLIQEGDLRGDALRDPWGNQLAYRCLQSDCTKVEVESLGEGVRISKVVH